MRSMERQLRKLEQVMEEHRSGGVCVINASTDEEAEAQLAAYKEANGEPTTVIQIEWVPAVGR